MSKTPTSFKNLKKSELVAAADRFGTNTEGTNEEIILDLTESGVTWEMYAAAFGLDKTEEPKKPENVITSDDVNNKEEEDSLVEENVVAASAPVMKPEDKYLVKMVRQNPYFEFKGYKFTQEDPYAIMSAADAQTILSNEEGFRQAFPQELQDYYS